MPAIVLLHSLKLPRGVKTLNDLFDLKKKPEKTIHLDIVPILDALVALIFFLLISTSFVQLTKHTIPPSAVSTITDPIVPPPLSPKIYVHGQGEQLAFTLKWEGTKPGSIQKKIVLNDEKESLLPKLRSETKKIIKNFLSKYPNEKSIQLGLSENTSYQDMVAIMDGIKEDIPDIVLISYKEVGLWYQNN